jgi:chromosome partitioning protein
MSIPMNYQQVIDQWKQIGSVSVEQGNNYPEAALASNLVSAVWQAIGINQITQIAQPAIGTGTPDALVYKDGTRSSPPILTCEYKLRKPSYYNAPEAGFTDFCLSQNGASSYRGAIGHVASVTCGIKQYLDIDNVNPPYLAKYGWVFNGDFSQLWRRVDGLVFPLTPIQKVTDKTWPTILAQLKYCLSDPHKAVVVSVWNQKGGVAKTTNTLNIAATLAVKGKKVLLVDLDPQEDLTIGVGLDPNEHNSDYLKRVTDKLELQEIEAASSVLNEVIKNRHFPTTDHGNYSLDILPGNREMLEQFRLSDSQSYGSVKPFKKLIELLSNKYDYIFVAEVLNGRI